MYDWILKHSVIIGLLIDIISLAVSVFLTALIYKLECRRENENAKEEDRIRQGITVERAKAFLIDNDSEVELLPLSAIAAELSLKRKHNRCITTRFLRCPRNLQDEILRQANVQRISFSMEDVENALDCLQKSFDENRFGRMLLYDGAKYLHRAFNRWSNVKINNVNPYIFDNLLGNNYKYLFNCRCSAPLFSYMRTYLQAEENGLHKEDVTPPIDMVYQKCNLGACAEEKMTFWTMRIIVDACHLFAKEDIDYIIDEDLIKTQEDMYYYTLATLCLAYPSHAGEGR